MLVLNSTRFYTKNARTKPTKREMSFKNRTPKDPITEETIKSGNLNLHSHTRSSLMSVKDQDSLFMLEMLMTPQNKQPPLIKEEPKQQKTLTDLKAYFAQSPRNRSLRAADTALFTLSKTGDIKQAKELFELIKVIVAVSDFSFSISNTISNLI
jgi:hypothetical protein